MTPEVRAELGRLEADLTALNLKQLNILAATGAISPAFLKTDKTASAIVGRMGEILERHLRGEPIDAPASRRQARAKLAAD